MTTEYGHAELSIGASFVRRPFILPGGSWLQLSMETGNPRPSIHPGVPVFGGPKMWLLNRAQNESNWRKPKVSQVGVLGSYDHRARLAATCTQPPLRGTSRWVCGAVGEQG